MKKICLYSVVGLIVLFALVSEDANAQKRKKSSETASSGMRLREAEFYFTEGEKYFILEDYAKALLYFQKALEINATNATVHYKIAEVLSQSNKQDDLSRAALSIEEALSLEKKNKFFYLLAANIYSNLNRFDKAARAYEDMIREIKGTEEYLYDLAALYQYNNDRESAIKVYNRAEALMGINEISSVQKQRLFLESGRLKEAIAEGEKLIQAYPFEERYVMAFAEVLAHNDQRPLAVRYLQKFIEDNYESANAQMLLASLYREVNEEAKARDLLLKLFDKSEADFNSKVLVLGTYNAELNQAKGQGARDAEKEKFSIQLLEKLKQAHPDDPTVFILGGDLYLATGDLAEAERHYQRATQSEEVNFEVWQNMIYLQLQLEKFDLVIDNAEKALELYPNQGILYYFNGLALMRKRQFREAIASLEQARRISGTNNALLIEIYSLLGDAYNATKEYDKSDKAYDAVLAMNPDNSLVLNNYSYYLSLRKANLEKAEKMSAQLVKNHPDNPTFLDTHAWVLYTRQKYKEARKVIERAIATGKASATHVEHYGDILYQLGEVDAAVQQWEKARGMNANSEKLKQKIANRKIYE